MPTKSEIQALHDRITELEELVGLRKPHPRFIRNSGIGKIGWDLLCLLAEHSLVSREFAVQVIYGDRSDYPSDRMIDQHVCRLNSALKPYKIRITPENGIGYFLDAENKSRLSALMVDQSITKGKCAQ